MMTFYNLSENCMSLFLTAAFLTLCIGCVCLVTAIQRNHFMTAVSAVICCVLDFMLVVLYTANMKASLLNRALPEIVSDFSQLPVLLTLAVLACIIVTETVILLQEYRYQKKTITHASIREGFDHLNTGLCFSKPNGIVMLTNHKMVSLGFALTGEEVQNAVLFWELLRNGEIKTGAKRLSYGDTPEFMLPDGTIWTFRQEKLNDILQLTAAETTDLHQLMDRLHEENKQLEAMYQRIRDYGDKVDQYVISKERLETRVNLHSFLGQALLTTRHHLKYEGGDVYQIIDMWQRNIDVLKLEADPQPVTDAFNSLITTANALGMKVTITGNIPKEAQIKKLMALAGAEVLTNAVQHAGASTLFIEITELDDEYIAQYTNDGTVPEGEITEGGGLSSLRSKVKYAGGKMEINSQPQFLLTLTLRKEVIEYD